MAKVTKAEYQEQLAKLREWLKPGDTLYTDCEHVSRSGMQRTIRVLIPYVRDQVPCDCHSWPAGSPHFVGAPQVDFLHPNYAVSVITGYTLDRGPGRNGVKVGGCGMDMGFHLVGAVSARLYGGRRCDCGAWYDDARPGQHFTQAEYEAREGGWSNEGWHYRYAETCPKCAGSGNVRGTGYQCLGKGKCPSNYHTNHRDRLRCEGVKRGDEYIRCAAPSPFGRYKEEIPEDWPTAKIRVGGKGSKETVTKLLHTLFTPEGEYGREICPTCKGEGDYPNPEGPERFDLEHFDGYAIRQRWL